MCQQHDHRATATAALQQELRSSCTFAPHCDRLASLRQRPNSRLRYDNHAEAARASRTKRLSSEKGLRPLRWTSVRVSKQTSAAKGPRNNKAGVGASSLEIGTGNLSHVGYSVDTARDLRHPLFSLLELVFRRGVKSCNCYVAFTTVSLSRMYSLSV